ncbi:hypothetical protein [Salmonella phage UPWr_S5]|nr:hypothetical protein [Salmonella phage UPWr_S5]
MDVEVAATGVVITVLYNFTGGVKHLVSSHKVIGDGLHRPADIVAALVRTRLVVAVSKTVVWGICLRVRKVRGRTFHGRRQELRQRFKNNAKNLHDAFNSATTGRFHNVESRVFFQCFEVFCYVVIFSDFVNENTHRHPVRNMVHDEVHRIIAVALDIKRAVFVSCVVDY